MLLEDLESNAQRLYYNYPKTYLVRNEKFEEVGFGGIILRALMGRIVFAIRDLISWGGETRKVNDLALKTLEAMNEQLKSKPLYETRWHFDGDERFGYLVDNVTYKEFAKHILSNHQFDNEMAIRNQAEDLVRSFDEKIIFPSNDVLTSDETIHAVIKRKMFCGEVENGPSITFDRLQHLRRTAANDKKLLRQASYI